MDADKLAAARARRDRGESPPESPRPPRHQPRVRIRRITQDPEATLVKIADNADSIHPERITGTPDAETRRRLAEFEEARRILWPAAPREDIIKVVSPINRPLLDRLAAA